MRSGQIMTVDEFKVNKKCDMQVMDKVEWKKNIAIRRGGSENRGESEKKAEEDTEIAQIKRCPRWR